MSIDNPVNIDYRNACTADFEGILRLQHRNLLVNIQMEDLSQGFLSVELTWNQLQTINTDLGIFVSIHDKTVIGYLMAETVEFAMGSPLMALMLQRIKGTTVEGFPLSTSRLFVYGPVCIESRYRGIGILEKLFALMKETLKDDYDVGIAFVAQINARSYHAHTTKLGMKKIDSFEYLGKQYFTLAFRVRC